MGRERITILDGGMGTTLECLGHSVSSELWGSELIFENPDIIQGIHQKYYEAGADLVETSTYQLTQNNLSSYLKSTSKEELSESEYERKSQGILKSAVNLVYNSIPSSSSSSSSEKKGVVFSCGPYGSTLKPGAEYSGLYPKPFGPNSRERNYFQDSEIEEEENSIEKLSEFHLSKLLNIALNEEIWKKIEWIGFETIPLLYEIKSIRRCMKKLNKILRNKYSNIENNEGNDEIWFIKKFWICSPFPDGEFPQLNSSGSNQHVPIEDVVDTLLNNSNENLGPLPNGIGINCTNPKYLLDLSKKFTFALSQKIKIGDVKLSSRPIFVLYPDGGQVYDVNTRTWSIPTNGPASSEEWSKGILQVVNDVESTKGDNSEYIWNGVIVGGCCKTSFDDIKALKRNLDDQILQ
ncbi:uncharacterized protein L201_001611 [Kwoniella dendrophila CBS 6074]|uniref:Hcy-binding domain-containing protein n=1 Tax=Kwoniella dendrophila CBS 6074 TaxID=1295534 RepID=A0AAX4JPC8_9TREE